MSVERMQRKICVTEEDVWAGVDEDTVGVGAIPIFTAAGTRGCQEYGGATKLAMLQSTTNRGGVQRSIEGRFNPGLLPNYYPMTREEVVGLLKEQAEAVKARLDEVGARLKELDVSEE